MSLPLFCMCLIPGTKIAAAEPSGSFGRGGVRPIASGSAALIGAHCAMSSEEKSLSMTGISHNATSLSGTSFLLPTASAKHVCRFWAIDSPTVLAGVKSNPNRSGVPSLLHFLAMWASPLVVVPWFAASSQGREPMNGWKEFGRQLEKRGQNGHNYLYLSTSIGVIAHA